MERPLRIGPIEIPCYVLTDGTRVLAQRGLQSGIGMSEGGGQKGARKIAEFMVRLAAKGIDIKDLVARVNSPIRFIPPHGGNPADGYEATILPDICAVIIDADQKGKLAIFVGHQQAVIHFTMRGQLSAILGGTLYREVRIEARDRID